MKVSSRVILVTGIALVLIIASLYIVFRFHIPWVWPEEKWPDFWIALISGMIAIATIGAIATFVVERILRDIEEQRSEKLFQTTCEKEWEEFEQRLYNQFLAKSAFSNDFNYENIGIPHDAEVLAKLLETAPLSRWQKGLTSPSFLFSKLRNFELNYFGFKTSNNRLVKELRIAIYQYYRNQAASGQIFATIMNEERLLAICIRLILEDNEVNLEFSRDMIFDEELDEALYKSKRDRRLSRVAADIVWKLRLTETEVSDCIKLYNFIKDEVDIFYISRYIFWRESLEKYSGEVKEMIFQNEEQERRNAAFKEIVDYLFRENKQKKLDKITLTLDRMVLKDWRDELTTLTNKTQTTDDFFKLLDALISKLDQLIEKMEAPSGQAHSNAEN